MAGYSGTPLAKKLGIKADQRIAFANAPESVPGILGVLPDGVEIRLSLKGSRSFDLIVFFTRSRSELQLRFERLVKRIKDHGSVWIAWPKRSSGVETNLSENDIREMGLAVGLVDNKVCAIDETWSGLRFVLPVKERARRR
jgi:hypothetical protein